MTADTSKKLKTAEVEKISHIDYFKIAISVDCVIFGFEKKELRVLLKFYAKLANMSKEEGSMQQTHSIEEAEELHEEKQADKEGR